MMRIITREMVENAIKMLEASVQSIFDTPECVWGPKYVYGFVRVPGIDRDIPFEIGSTENWNIDWGKAEHFAEIAKAKLELSDRTKLNTSEVVALSPWLLEGNEYLYGGGAHYKGISVGVSGLEWQADEMIAKDLINRIVALALLETSARISAENMRI